MRKKPDAAEKLSTCTKNMGVLPSLSSRLSLKQKTQRGKKSSGGRQYILYLTTRRLQHSLVRWKIQAAVSSA